MSFTACFLSSVSSPAAVEIAAENGWADYVFAKDYKLMPLKEVEKYININGHLPEVPSTEEAIKNGIELKEMNILLLKKVEELTLMKIGSKEKWIVSNPHITLAPQAKLFSISSKGVYDNPSLWKIYE